VIGGESYKAADVDYYYNSAYNQIKSNYGDYFSYFVDTSKSLKSQDYSDTQSWHDYILEQALQSMQETMVLAKEAEKAGFTLSQEGLDNIDLIKEQVDQVCTSYGITHETYFKSFGDTMTEEIFYEHVTYSHLADEYLAYLRSQMVYSTDELEAYYQDNPSSIDKVDYRYFFFSTTASDGQDATQLKTSALAAAEDMAARLHDGEDFTALTQEYAAEENKDSYADAAASTATGFGSSYISSYIGSAVADWLFDTGRAAGDITTIETDSGYYVLLFKDRYRDDYNTVDVRHILIQPEVSDGADAATDEQKAAAKAEAETIYAEWKAGEATEASFAALAEQYSSDTGSSTNGGLYEQVYKNQMVTAFNDWCFDSARKSGDTGIVETDYGYHIIYFVGEDTVYWQLQVQALMTNEDYDAWYNGVLVNYEMSDPKFGINFVG
jgi:parvulin-like peptidyl-prolyl isomerase